MSHEPHLYDEDRRHMYTVSLDMTCVREGESLSGMVDTCLSTVEGEEEEEEVV